MRATKRPLIDRKYLSDLVFKSFKSVHLWQEPMLCWPHRYTVLLGACPSEARALKAVEPSKKKSYLEVASILLRKYPNASTSRSVTFLLKICNNDPPDGVPRLPWLEAPSAQARVINLTNSSAFTKLAPAMRFNAILRGWWKMLACWSYMQWYLQQSCWTVTCKFKARWIDAFCRPASMQFVASNLSAPCFLVLVSTDKAHNKGPKQS